MRTEGKTWEEMSCVGRGSWSWGAGWPGWRWPGRWAGPGSRPADRAGGRLGGRRDRHVPARQRRPRSGGARAGGGGGGQGRHHHQRLLDHHGRLLAEIDLDGLWGDVGACLALPQAELHRSCAAWPSGWAGRSRRWSTWTGRSSDLRRQPRTATTWSSGPTGSARRSAAGRRPPPPGPGRPAQLAVPDPHPRHHHLDGHARPGTSFLTIPIGGLVHCCADITTNHDSPAPPTSDPLAGCVSSRPASPPRAGAAGPAARPEPGPCGPDRAGGRRTAQGRGAVVLVGDAAHAMSPNMAQGAALAFEDALVLAACLAQAGSVAEALAGFVARRPPRAKLGPRPDPPPAWLRRDLPPLLRDPLLGPSAGASSGPTTSRFWPTPEPALAYPR